MDLHKKIQEINNRWNIPDDLSHEEKFQKFKTRILNIFAGIDRRVSVEGVSTFCNVVGVKEKWTHSPYHHNTNIIDILTQETNPKQLYKLIEIIFALNLKKIDAAFLYLKLCDALKYSNIGVSITEKNDGEIILYPSGEEFLDEELVNGVLSFLNNKPQHHFIDALKFYEQNTPKSRVKSAESLRRTLEEFLHLKLSNRKGLKANIPELGALLKKMTVNNDLKNLVIQTLRILDQFFNENSKHQDGNITEVENEFLIYQVALLMRYVHKII